MFRFLKDKLKKWTEKISDETLGEENKSIKKSKEKKRTNKEIELEKINKDNLETKKLSNQEEIIEENINDIQEEDATEEKEVYKETKKNKNFFSKLISSNILFKEEDFDSYKEELETILLENNVAFEVTEKILIELKNSLVGKEISKKELSKEIMKNFREILSQILIEPFNIIEKINQKSEPYVILFCGINGTGKTTTIAKFASMLKKNKISCVLAAGDTFRAASIEQIKTHGEKIKVPVIALKYGSDPASVGFEAINYAKKNKIKVVLIDSAGRMHTAKNLMNEIEKVSKVCKPDSKIFVGESIAGNDIISQVTAFDASVNLNGIILAKADVDEKGGSAISVGYITKKPILFLGTGQDYKDLEAFDKEKFLNKIFK
jgi:fused signal recognition particle receptor